MVLNYPIVNNSNHYSCMNNGSIKKKKYLCITSLAQIELYETFKEMELYFYKIKKVV